MPIEIIDSFPQNRVKECFVPCPLIDLTLRCNGEQYPEVLTPMKRRVPCRMDAPTTAPPAPSLLGAGTFPANKYFCYVYVYAAENAFPLVQNAVAGGTSLGPRSNASPSVTVNTNLSTNIRQLSVPTTPSTSWWISHVWFYRTEYFDTQQEAEDNARGGVVFYIGKAVNDPNVGTVLFQDNNLPLQQQVESDNFPAPQFKRAVYSNNYFWGFCNDPLTVEIDVDLSGVLTIVNYPTDRWYDGRDGQIARLAGLDSGGFDNHGTFYFKSTGNDTGQLYSDIALTIPSTLLISGRTKITLTGPSTRLYRSKVNNPFAWGETNLIGDVQVPAPYFFDLGGGRGRAISVIPNLGYLKLDVEAPNKTLILNLKNAGTPNFETSLRPIAENYCTSIHESHFSATLDQGTNVMWGVDTKSRMLVESDGSAQRPISSKIYRTLRGMVIDGSSEQMYHGAYSQKLELNCFMFRDQINGEFASYPYNNKLVFQHGPTGYWGAMDCYDINCAIEMVDNGIIRLMAGNSEGWIGELFSEDQYSMWFTPYMSEAAVFNFGFGKEFYYSAGGGSDNVMLSDIPGGFPSFGAIGTGIVPNYIVGNWVTVVRRPPTSSTATQTFICHISGTTNDGTPNNNALVVDKVLQRLQNRLEDVELLPAFNNINYPGAWTSEWYIGLIESTFGRSFTAGFPQNQKKIEEFWSSWIMPTPFTINIPTIEYQFGYTDNFGGQLERFLVEKTLGDATALVENLGNTLKPKVYAHIEGIPIDLGKVFGIIIRDRNYVASRLLNYDIQLTPTD